MCIACEMDAWWFASMEAHARTAAAEAGAQAQSPSRENENAAEGGEGGKGGMTGDRAEPHPNSPPEDGGGAPSHTIEARQRDAPTAPRFACEETQAE
jgi:hypothetical protein